MTVADPDPEAEGGAGVAARYCVECGGFVTTSYCPNCGAFQPPQILDPSDTGGGRSEWTQTGRPVADSLPPVTGGAAWSAQDSAPPAGSDSAWSARDARPPGDAAAAQGGSGSWWQESIGREQPDAADPTSQIDPISGGWPIVEQSPTTALPPQASDQPYRPFEHSSWTPPSQASGRWSSGPADGGSNFMGVTPWEADAQAPPPRNGSRSTWIAVFAVVAVLVAIGAVVFVVLRSQSTDGATSNDNPSSVVPTATATSSPSRQPSASQILPPAVTVTVTPSGPTTGGQSGPSTPVVDPLGGPEKNIACGPGFIVQVASAADEASFRAQVAALRAANRVPKDVFHTQVSASCPIFTGQSNSWVLYAGPFAGQYDGCAARLAAAPDSFIRGTTPDTARQYISCLCPADNITLPTISSVGQTGVWVGELQRILANKLNIKINDLGSTWGTFTAATSDAVKKFQKDKKLPENGLVDAVTWQALKAAQC